MKLSIIIPAFNIVSNGVKLIEKMKEYIADCKDVEVIYIDDGSTDGTPEFIKNNFMDKRVKVISQKNSRVAIARINGVKATSDETTHIIFVDADDFIEGDIQEFFKNKNYKNIIFRFRKFFVKDGRKWEFEWNEKETPNLFRVFLKMNAIHGYAFPKEILLSGLTNSKECFEDVYYILWAKGISENFPKINIEKIECKYFVNVLESSLSREQEVNSENFKNKTNDLANVWQQVWNDLDNSGYANTQMRFIFITKYLSEYFHIANKINKEVIANAYELIRKPKSSHKEKSKINLKQRLFIALLRTKIVFVIKKVIEQTMK